MTQRIIEIDSPFFVREEQLATPDDLLGQFPSRQPLALEIGCGTGHFVAELAAANRDRNFLAVDIYNKGCLKTCRRIEQTGLDNVRVMRIEARYLLVNLLGKESLAAVYINCPDPWPKKRHRSRRLVGRTFMELLQHYLEPAGDFFFSTDFDDYAEQVAGFLPELAGYENVLSAPWVNALPGYPVSKYMQRFLDLGQPIYFMHYRRRRNLALAEVAAPQIRAGFRARWGTSCHG